MSPDPAVIASQPAWRREFELLLLLARPALSPIEAEQARALLGEGLDWALLIDSAEDHGLIPLLHRHLRRLAADIPPQHSAELNNLVQFHTRNALLLVGELFAVLRLLEEHGIPALPFKGPALAEQLYGDVALRQFRDLDVMVPPHAIERARCLLAARGYRTFLNVNKPSPELTPSQLGWLLRSDSAFSLVRGDFVVELHWRFTTAAFTFPIDYEALWGRLEPGSLLKRPVQRMPAEDLLLMLCMHGSRHFWTRLVWLVDVAVCLERYPDLRWEALLEQASACGSARMLLLGLYLAHALLHAPLPDVVLARFERAPEIRRLAATVATWLFDERACPSGRWPFSQLFHMRLRERVRDRVHFALHWSFTPTTAEWEKFPLPDSLAFAYYLLRPLRVASKCGLGLLQRPSVS